MAIAVAVIDDDDNVEDKKEPGPILTLRLTAAL